MRAIEFITEAKVPPVRDQIRADIKKNGPGEYFVRVADVDKLGFSARQKFGRSPDMDDPAFDVDYIGAGKGRPALWFYPVNEYLNARDLYATESPYVWLVKLKDTAWLQPARRGAAGVANPPQGKQRVGIMRHSNPPAAIFFEPGFDVVGKYYDYAGQHKRHGQVKGAPKPTFFDRVRGVDEGAGTITEYRDRLLQYVKSLLPTWPEYVLKDWLVPNKGDFSNLPDTELKNGIMEKLQGAGLTPNSKWQLVPDMKFTMDMFDPMTKQRLIGRAGGKSDLGMQIPRDAERHATQAALAQQQGGVRKEPVLLIKTANGYELLEGWHRTIQHFAKYPDGYTGPAYVAVDPNQPKGMKRQKTDPTYNVNEAFDQPYRLRWEAGDYGDVDAIAKMDDGNYLSIMFNKGYNQDKEEAWSVEFFRNNSQEVTGEGDAQRVFATVLSAIQKFIKKYKPNRVIFSASKEVEQGQNAQSRARLYDSLVQRYAKAWGFRAFRADTSDKVIYELNRIKPVKEDAETTTEHYNGIEISLEKEDDEILITAMMANGREMGHVLFVQEGDYLMPQDLEVEERYQGQGIAATMYDYVKSKGYKIRRSGQQTDAGAGFWDKHRPEQNVWEQDVAEGSEQKYLWHGSRQKIPMLEPRQSVDTGGAAGSNQNAIYATSDPKVAIAVGGLTTPDSDTAMFPNDPQMVLFSGKIRKGENVYLHKLPFYSPDGKPQFVQGAHDREFYSIPGVKGIKPTEIKAVPVDKYLNLIRKATPADLELRKKNMKEQGVAENFADGRNPGRKGLSRRVGIPKKATLGQLEKIAGSSTGERHRMAQWQLNMRRGKKK